MYIMAILSFSPYNKIVFSNIMLEVNLLLLTCALQEYLINIQIVIDYSIVFNTQSQVK